MEFDDRHSIYLQIVDYIVERILKRNYSEGERIPSVREMAVDIQVNPNTVVRSYAELQERGVVHNQRGIGYFVTDGAFETVRRAKMDELVTQEVPRIAGLLDLLEMSADDFCRSIKEYQEEQDR